MLLNDFCSVRGVAYVEGEFLIDVVVFDDGFRRFRKAVLPKQSYCATTETSASHSRTEIKTRIILNCVQIEEKEVTNWRHLFNDTVSSLRPIKSRGKLTQTLHSKQLLKF